MNRPLIALSRESFACSRPFGVSRSTLTPEGSDPSRLPIDPYPQGSRPFTAWVARHDVSLASHDFSLARHKSSLATLRGLPCDTANLSRVEAFVGRAEANVGRSVAIVDRSEGNVDAFGAAMPRDARVIPTNGRNPTHRARDASVHAARDGWAVPRVIPTNGRNPPTRSARRSRPRSA